MNSSLNKPQDDLEYYITFPTSDKNTLLTKNEGGKVCSVKNSNSHSNIGDFSTGKNAVEPLIFLMGWLGAQDRHLAKYSAMYSKIGCVTIRYTAPTQNLFFFPHRNMRALAEKLLRVLEDTALIEHPIIFHSFSNHGSTLYSCLSDVILEKNGSLNVKGTVFDSCPAPRGVLSGVSAMYRSTPGPYLLRLLVSGFLFFYLFTWKYLDVIGRIFTRNETHAAPWCLIQERSRWPQLFLYSQADDLIPSYHIEHFVEERRKLGVEVFTHDYISSPHVAHYKTFEKEYEEDVTKFVRHCIENGDDATSDKNAKKLN